MISIVESKTLLFRGILIAALASTLAAAGLPNPVADEKGVQAKTEKIVLAGGCFWGVQAVYSSTKGVLSAVSGYSGGSKLTAHYEIVSSGTTGHAESVEVTFDPTQISFGQLLKIYFSVVHDPTQLNRQTPDEGTQYRSSIFYTSEEQKRVADAYIQQLTAAKAFPKPIVTKVVPLQAFYQAEDYHQDYVFNCQRGLPVCRNKGYVEYFDIPKLASFHKEFPELAKGGK